MASLVRSLFSMVKKPWEITGLASSSEWLEYMPTGHDYRKHSPGSQPVAAKVPHDVPQLVYNTRYYGRDYRRNNKYTMRTVDRTPLDVEQMLASWPVKPEDIKVVPRPLAVKDRGV